MNSLDSAWKGVWSLDAIVNRRLRRPRVAGVTMVIDTGLGLSAMRDILDLAAHHIDHWKFGFGTTALMPRAALEAKLSLLRSHNIVSYPGGTLLEAAVVQEHCRVFMTRAAELGFEAVEISEGTIDLPGERRRRMIDCARNAGLQPITEVGRKDPARQPVADELAAQVLRDLEWGARWVIIEGRESGQGVGIYDRAGDIRSSYLDEVTRLVGDAASRMIWEAPLRAQQAYLVCRFGANVSLGNIPPHQCLALEALRCGLRFESFAAVAKHSRDAGVWDPARLEDGTLSSTASDE
ncbi:phosphosulfolactate synthase [Methylocystis sp. JR02]|uniref:phosphosulfolactate synthase n=1 Tax=Methylocystis sp. JR02 TaxID=3046284 RepID=UPI0024BA3E1C|nr:phosphosulfolactate synthase [Methylocystis sp. JR02]MDJ0447428.1 phosphosulfolactate synthase [Methylocystis sp. JR02]